MTSRIIEQMLKEVEEQVRLRNIRVLHSTTGLSYEQLFDILEIPTDNQQRFLDMLTSPDKENEQ